MGSYKPDGYTSVSPYLIVDGASATIDFLRRVFAADEIRRFADPAGKVMHAEVRIDDTVVMIADGADGWRGTSTLRASPIDTRSTRPARSTSTPILRCREWLDSAISRARSWVSTLCGGSRRR